MQTISDGYQATKQKAVLADPDYSKAFIGPKRTSIVSQRIILAEHCLKNRAVIDLSDQGGALWPKP